MSEIRENHRGAPLARYANYFDIGHNTYEFLIDFGQFRPESEDVTLHTRIVFGPTHAKLLAELFRNAVQQYEADHGPIAALGNSVNTVEAT